MKANTHPNRTDKHAGAKHPNQRKQKALELSAHAEHETGAKRERLIREAARKAE